ncbi:hypothetical protein [Gracilimonas tropica]|uniref:hypothetical protein n=1 Tax=Gracilimonas tropica TaxID=454600 RepID=UPI00037A70F2|nr:hypothetical protein [Gracilimonas tropica]
MKNPMQTNPSMQEVIDREVMTIKEAQVYVEEKTGMKSSLFYDCVRPLLSPRPMAINQRTRKPAHFVVAKEQVEQVIFSMKKQIE